MRFLLAKIFGWIAKTIQSFGLSGRGGRGLSGADLWPNHACDRDRHRFNYIKETHVSSYAGGGAYFDSIQRYCGHFGRDGDAVDWLRYRSEDRLICGGTDVTDRVQSAGGTCVGCILNINPNSFCTMNCAPNEAGGGGLKIAFGFNDGGDNNPGGAGNRINDLRANQQCAAQDADDETVRSHLQVAASFNRPANRSRSHGNRQCRHLTACVFAAGHFLKHLVNTFGNCHRNISVGGHRRNNGKFYSFPYYYSFNFFPHDLWYRCDSEFNFLNCLQV